MWSRDNRPETTLISKFLPSPSISVISYYRFIALTDFEASKLQDIARFMSINQPIPEVMPEIKL